MRRLILAVAWLAACALAGPAAPIAEQPPAPDPAGLEQSTVPAPADSPPEVQPAAPAAEPVPPPGPAPEAPPPPPAEPAPPEQLPIAFAATPGSVTIQDFSFAPSSVTVNVGESVTWNNSGPSTHTATASDGSFDTGSLSRGESGSVTFDEAGTFSYICTPHPSMQGTVRVVAQASGDGTGADDGSSGAAGADDAATPTSPGATSSGAQLAQTGADPLWLAVTGIGLLLIGTAGMRWGVTRP